MEPKYKHNGSLADRGAGFRTGSAHSFALHSTSRARGLNREIRGASLGDGIPALTLMNASLSVRFYDAPVRRWLGNRLLRASFMKRT